MKKKLIIFLLLAYFLKELFWLGSIPLWHFPDEEQHFAQVAFQAEKGYSPRSKKVENDVSREIDISSEVLGTKRDKRGINKFTYHPEYRIPYSKTETGIYEKEIVELNTETDRKTMVKREAARYDPAYYSLSAFIYNLFYQEDLFVRVFCSRFISVFLSTLTILFTYLISQEIFKKEFWRLTLTFLVAFQPMFSFVSAGVNNDNLFNLVFTMVLYCSLKLMFLKKSYFKNKKGSFSFLFFLSLLVFALFLGFKTKKQIIIALPIMFFGFLLSLIKRSKKAKKETFSFLFLGLIGWLAVSKGRIDIPEYEADKASKLGESLFEYVFWHLRHTIAETIPWYWGVFNWLGVTLPRWVNQIQARMLIISTLGIIIYFLRRIKSKTLTNLRNLKVIFLLAAVGFYYFAIILWDYFFRRGHGFSFGIQGRYFFPTIVCHMVIILLGLTSLVPEKFKVVFAKILVAWWFIFSLIGLQTALGSYYQLWPINIFLTQASQYKPRFFKSIGLSTIFILFFMTTLLFLFNFFRVKLRVKEEK